MPNEESKPLESRRSESLAISSSRSRSSRSSPVNFEYRYFMGIRCSASVVILLLVAGERHVPLQHRIRGRLPRIAPRRLGALVLAILRARDLLLRVEPLEDEV